MAKPKKPARKAAVKAAPKIVTFQAFGNSEIEVVLTAGNRTLKAFMKQNIPPAWNLDQFALRVNDREVNDEFVLNDGDRISAAPNVAGGKL